MVWKFCEIWKSYRNGVSEGPNSVRFYLTVWGMTCMIQLTRVTDQIYIKWLFDYLRKMRMIIFNFILSTIQYLLPNLP